MLPLRRRLAAEMKVRCAMCLPLSCHYLQLPPCSGRRGVGTCLSSSHVPHLMTAQPCFHMTLRRAKPNASQLNRKREPRSAQPAANR